MESLKAMILRRSNAKSTTTAGTLLKGTKLQQAFTIVIEQLIAVAHPAFFKDGMGFVLSGDLADILRRMRLVCRHMDKVITPLLYRTLDFSLGRAIAVLHMKELEAAPILANIFAHARFLKPHHSAWYQTGTTSLINGCKSLKKIEWTTSTQWQAYDPIDVTALSIRTRLAYLKTFLEKRDKAGNYFVSGNVLAFKVEDVQMETSILQKAQRLAEWGLTIEMGKQLTSPPSQSLIRLGGNTSGAVVNILYLSMDQLSFEAVAFHRAKFPAMKHLILDCGEGKYSGLDLVEIWDFSSLHSLALLGSQAPTAFFNTNTLTPNMLSKLKVLTITCSLDRKMHEIFAHTLMSIDELESLVIEDDNWSFYSPIRTLVSVAVSLRKLVLKGKNTIRQVVPYDFGLLQRCLSHIQHLGLDYVPDHCHSEGFFETLYRFKDLQSLDLTIYVPLQRIHSCPRQMVDMIQAGMHGKESVSVAVEERFIEDPVWVIPEPSWPLKSDKRSLLNPWW